MGLWNVGAVNVNFNRVREMAIMKRQIIFTPRLRRGELYRFFSTKVFAPWRAYVGLVLAGGLVVVSVGCGDLDAYNRPQVRPERYGVVTNPEELARPASPAGGSGPQVPPPTQPAGGAPGPTGGPGEAPPTPPSPPPAAAYQPPAPAPAQPPGPPPGYVREEARAGVTGRGDYRPGILTTPLSVYFRAQERIIFESQIPHAMRLYHATHGRYPGSWEEFEREILVANGIRLPQLPPGHRYHYDPATGQLLVEKPAP